MCLFPQILWLEKTFLANLFFAFSQLTLLFDSMPSASSLSQINAKNANKMDFFVYLPAMGEVEFSGGERAQEFITHNKVQHTRTPHKDKDGDMKDSNSMFYDQVEMLRHMNQGEGERLGERRGEEGEEMLMHTSQGTAQLRCRS